jgi:hypothetical protein
VVETVGVDDVALGAGPPFALAVLASNWKSDVKVVSSSELESDALVPLGPVAPLAAAVLAELPRRLDCRFIRVSSAVSRGFAGLAPAEDAGAADGVDVNAVPSE